MQVILMLQQFVGTYIYQCALKGWTLCRASISWSAGVLGTLNTRGQQMGLNWD